MATVKEQLAILISFSAEKNRYQVYNPIFDRAIKTLRITANQQLLFPKAKTGGGSDVIGINVPPPGGNAVDDMMPPPPRRTSNWTLYFVLLGAVAAAVAAYLYSSTRKGKSANKNVKPKTGKQ